MILKKWDNLPPEFKNDDVKKYYDYLDKKRFSLILKRLLDILFSLVFLILLSPVFLSLAILIKCTSKGPVFFRQVRVTQYGEEFRIFKFRTMVNNADKIGAQVTTGEDVRITAVGRIIRKCRLDEISQLIDVLRGKMTFVGVRPEVPKYVAEYSPEMMATLLLPAGVTSKTSILYKDEGKILDAAEDPDKAYIEQVLPQKMKHNLESILTFSIFGDIKIMFMTVAAMFGKEYGD